MFKELYKNEQIRAREVRLIDEEGNMLGIFPIEEAQALADNKHLDLVLISPTANPVVCKMMDYTKYKYEKIKQAKEDRKKQLNSELKELRLSAVIDIGDLKIKAKKAREFLENGDKVSLVIRMKSRQFYHPEISIKVMNDFFEMVSDVALIEKAPKREGRAISMILAPQKKPIKVKEDKENA